MATGSMKGSSVDKLARKFSIKLLQHYSLAQKTAHNLIEMWAGRLKNEEWLIIQSEAYGFI